MREVKCQILSQDRVNTLRKYAAGFILVIVSYCVLSFSQALAQATPTNQPPLEDEIQQTSEISNSQLQSAPTNENIIVEQDLESLKKTALELNRDLLILEEELLFPSNTQIVIFLSTDVGKFFTIDSVKLKINDTLVASHLYTPYENDALVRGGVQRLYIGNLKQGQHEITAVYTGEGPDDRKYKRAATLNIEKDDDPIMLELLVQDETTNMQPTFEIKEWEL